MQVPFKVVEVGDNIFISQASHGDEPLFRQGPNIAWFERLHEVLCFGMDANNLLINLHYI